jgi:hypothetical protein
MPIRRPYHSYKEIRFEIITSAANIQSEGRAATSGMEVTSYLPAELDRA